MGSKRTETSLLSNSETLNTGALCSPSTQASCWSVKVRAEYGWVSEKPDLAAEKWLEMARDERIIESHWINSI